MFKVIADSTCDLTKELRDQYDIDYCHMQITCDDKEYLADLDYKLYSVKELYDWMRNGKRVYTSQVTALEYQTVFSKYLEQGLDVLYIACSSALSASINTALLVKETLEKKFPGRKVVVIDSLLSCIGQGMMAIKASELQKEGKSLEEVEHWVNENKLRFNQFATVENLNYLKAAGRVKASKAFFGNLFVVKPILISDVNGRNYAVSKRKGRKGSILEICKMAIDAMEGDFEQTVYVAHADAGEDCELLKETLTQLEPRIKNIVTVTFGPIIGASTGPGTLGIFVYGKEVTLKE